MFCCTFYSYKGGVGRTLSLANVAVQLAISGKKVLVVDFDLEAPGLETLPPFQNAINRPGVIDFVTSFMRSNVVPDARDFISSSQIDFEGKSFSIDIMPAGVGDSGYSQAYSAIEWAALYQKQDGFLLMEDLRQQWADLGYEYVFLDSRTGHTDVGGVCTRQLPDLVVVVFFPNLQNLEGLKQIVPEIRQSTAREFPVELLFVASRVPKLDDEHGVLSGLLNNFQGALEYQDNELLILEQYDSLSLLEQEIFVQSRPRSGLAKQFRQLAHYVTRVNLQDPDGAAGFLRATFEELRAEEANSAPSLAEDQYVLNIKLKRVGIYHPDDSYIHYLLARVAYINRELLEASVHLDKCINFQGRTRVSEGVPQNLIINAHRFRLRLATELDAVENVKESALAILNEPGARENAIIDAIGAAANVAPEIIPPLASLPALNHAQPKSLLSLARRLVWSQATNEISASLIEIALEQAPKIEDISYEDVSTMQLPLISTGRFELAFRIFESLQSEEAGRLDTLFNSAMAKWGRDKKPDIDFFWVVLQAFDSQQSHGSANALQCKALVHGVLGQIPEMLSCLEGSRRAIDGIGHLEFSCWNYRNVPPQDFIEHLSAIRKFVIDNGDQPEFLSAHP